MNNLSSIEKFKYVNTLIYTRSKMANITLAISDDLKKELQHHQEVNWSAVIRKALQEHITKIEIAEAIAKKSKLTKKDVEEIDKLVKKGIAKAHNL